MNNIVITGASSAIGARLLDALSRREGVRRVVVLSRGDAAASRERGASPRRATAEVVWRSADARLPRLGLDEAAFRALAADVDAVFHCAERAALDDDIEAARAENVTPVRSMIELLEAAPGARLVHLSTAWVAGAKRGLFTEFDLHCVQEFCNAYEQSKHEAELLLAGSPVARRVTVARRSIAIYGAPDGGAAGNGAPDGGAAGNGAPDGGAAGDLTLAAAVRALRGRRLLVISGDPGARVDLVPIDYVVDGMAALATHPGAAGRTCHLVAGWDRSWTLRALLDALQARCGLARIRCVPPLFAPPGLPLGAASSPARLDALRPYLRQRCVFDAFLARRLLEPLGISCPPPDAHLGRALDAVAREVAGAPAHEAAAAM